MANTENNTAITINANTVHHINMSNITKLTNTNYIVWKLQVHSLLDGHELTKHLDEAEGPAATVTVGSVTSPNPAHTKWKRQDKLIYSALIGSISSPLQQLVTRTTTAAQIWEKLANTYANPSRTHIRTLKDQLKVFHKGAMTIDEYIQGITTRLDTLALLGSPLEHDDQIEHILEGLPDDFKPVIDQIAAKDKPPQITEVHERLLNHESKLLSKQAASTSLLPASANNAQHRNNQSNNRNNNSVTSSFAECSELSVSSLAT
ncbi:hypothetical protein ISN44_As12g038390 [Arabidopsis suecica]|uniref:Retrotransposon Copia-like N-terminal domain-containing protein n=1 Tax=Arabidopsis suecica TaxID=45249 RepID=A0A8T1YR85_ARASU|nr:hypothetical protein ISN44_As12g038390 [Arabidopsis suecica]